MLKRFVAFLVGIVVPVFAQPVTVTVRTDRLGPAFTPKTAFGAGVDGLERGDVGKVYTPANLKAMGAVGYGPLTYRLRTELGVEAWHWNPAGHWSDPAHRRGYWTSQADGAGRITLSHGFRLPRRGTTEDQANNDGYSRLDDGDPKTFWKSNPYLTRRFTGDDDAQHPQWVVLDLKKPRPVDAIRLDWAAPFAVRYRIDYWPGPEPKNDSGISNTFGGGDWRPFPWGTITSGHGGQVVLRLAPRPVQTRWVRVWMTQGSGAAPAGAGDPRDACGYALAEAGVGHLSGGHFQDFLAHQKGHGQSPAYASSTDPWHAASDEDPNVEQPGFDRVFASGLTHRLPLLTPVALAYGTPEDSAAEIRWLRARGYPVHRVEMGEEPDGQYMTPEDYGALYAQWADALYWVDPTLELGGPGFQTAIQGWVAWPDAHGDRSWMRRFLHYLQAHGHLQDLAFCSFEWYPFDDVCGDPSAQLRAEPDLLQTTLRRLRAEGLPKRTPLLITEYGYSAFAGEPEMDLPGAILNTETVAQFLTLGGQTAYLYGLEPNTPITENCPKSWGNLAVLLSDDDRRVRARLATGWAFQVLTHDWAQPGPDGVHRVFPVETGTPWVTAYAVRRPDRRWAVLLLNKDMRHPRSVRVAFRTPSGPRAFCGPVVCVQYGPAQYRWRASGEASRPWRDLPPVRSAVHGGAIVLPPRSLTILRGKVAEK